MAKLESLDKDALFRDLRKRFSGTAFTRDDGGKYQPKICPACREDRHGERFIADLCPRCFSLGVPYPDDDGRMLKSVSVPPSSPQKAPQKPVYATPRYENRAKQYNIPGSRGSTRPRPRLESRWREPKDKHGRYRVRLRAAGKCPHCGDPCAPYYECERRRFYKRLKYHLNRSVHLGILYRTPAGEYGLTEWVKKEPVDQGGARMGVVA